MKAYGECPKCGEYLETDCCGCIDGKSAIHDCSDKESKEFNIVDNVLWKLVPENEKELLENEDEK